MAIKEKMAKTADPTTTDAARAFLVSKAAKADNGSHSVKTKDIIDFFETQGIPEAVQNKLLAAKDALISASIDYIGEDLLTNIESKKKAGEDSDSSTSNITLHFADGRSDLTMAAHSVHRVPTHLPSMAGKDIGDGLSHHYGTVTIRTTAKSMLNPRKEQLADWESKIKASLDI